ARAALTHDDVAREHLLAAETLHTEALAVRFAAVTGAAACLFMSHDPLRTVCSRSGSADIRDAHLGVGLPMRLLPQVVFAAPEFDDRHLVTLRVLFDRSQDLTAPKQRVAQPYSVVVRNQQDLVELHGAAGLCRELLDAQ